MARTDTVDAGAASAAVVAQLPVRVAATTAFARSAALALVSAVAVLLSRIAFSRADANVAEALAFVGATDEALRPGSKEDEPVGRREVR